MNHGSKAVRASALGQLLTSTALLYLVIFCAAFAFLFLGLDRRVNIYDEGLVLTAAMRVMAGQVPHRDFYINYGPAQSYLFAALFKLFGPSVLLVDLATKALLAVSVYAVSSRYCRRPIAACTSIVCVLWLFGLSYYEIALTPTSLLSLWVTMLVIPARRPSLSVRRVLLAGLLDGIVALFRYDVGLALIAIHGALLFLAAARLPPGLPFFVRQSSRALAVYLLGFLVAFLPAALAYLAVAPLYPFLYDIVLFQARYYRLGRSLPFPPVHLRTFENLAIYLPILIVLLSAGAIVRALRAPRPSTPAPVAETDTPDWISFLLAFALLAAVMYLKGLVRISLIHVYLALLPSLLLVAVLFEHRSSFHLPARALITSAMVLSVLTASWASIQEARLIRGQRSSVLLRFLSPSTQSPHPTLADWCALRNPLTLGPCFLLDPDHIQAIEFLSAHTSPADTLYVGVPHHDRIFANDNVTYFATQRLPSTMWSHFDPGLQNRSDIQEEIIRELDVRTPPYIALDAEFETANEPNDSSRSTGVHLLDQYIERNYQIVQTFGEISLWRRRPPR